MSVIWCRRYRISCGSSRCGMYVKSSSSLASKRFVCRKKIAKCGVQLRGKGCEIPEYLLSMLRGAGTYTPILSSHYQSSTIFSPILRSCNAKRLNMCNARTLLALLLCICHRGRPLQFSCFTSSFPPAHSTGCHPLPVVHRCPRSAAGSRGGHTVSALTAGRRG